LNVHAIGGRPTSRFAAFMAHLAQEIAAGTMPARTVSILLLTGRYARAVGTNCGKLLALPLGRLHCRPEQDERQRQDGERQEDSPVAPEDAVGYKSSFHDNPLSATGHLLSRCQRLSRTGLFASFRGPMWVTYPERCCTSAYELPASHGTPGRGCNGFRAPSAP